MKLDKYPQLQISALKAELLVQKKLAKTYEKKYKDTRFHLVIVFICGLVLYIYTLFSI